MFNALADSKGLLVSRSKCSGKWSAAAKAEESKSPLHEALLALLKRLLKAYSPVISSSIPC